MRTNPIPIFSVANTIASLTKKESLGVRIPQPLVDAEGLTLIDRLLILVDLLLCELREKLKTWLDILDGLRLEHARGYSFGPYLVPYFGSDKDRRPSVWASDRAG